jgi:hypothetical protein
MEAWSKDEDYAPTSLADSDPQDLPVHILRLARSVPSTVHTRWGSRTSQILVGSGWLECGRATPSHGFRKLGNSLVVARINDVCLAGIRKSLSWQFPGIASKLPQIGHNILD